MPLINAHAVISSKARGLNFGLCLHLHLHFEHESREGFGESAHIADSPEPLLLTNVTSIIISCTGPYEILKGTAI